MTWKITLEEAFGKTAEINVEVSQACEPCKGTGATPGTGAPLQPVRRPWQGPRAAGLLHGRARLPQLPWARRGHRKPCRHCRGEGRSTCRRPGGGYPAGVDTGTRIRLAGKGEAGPFGAPAGDLYIFLHIARHKVFERDGTTLLTRAPISFTTAALGGEIEIPGLDGSRHTIEIPAGIQSGKQLRKRGAGMPVLQGRGWAIWSWKSRSKRRPSFRPASANCCASSRAPKPARNARNPRVSSSGSGCLDGPDRISSARAPSH
jgi:molecular chaperone DnaJ